MKKFTLFAALASLLIVAAGYFSPADAQILNPAFLQSGTGAVARTYLDKGRDVKNAKDFGAKCDNAQDDVAKIQAAIDAVETAGGGVVELPAGICKITASILLKQNVTLKGRGIDATILAPTMAAPAITSPAYARDRAGLTEVGYAVAWTGANDLGITLAALNNAQGINFIGISYSTFRNIRIGMAGATYTGQKGVVHDGSQYIGAGGTGPFYNAWENITMDAAGNLAGSMGYQMGYNGVGNVVNANRIVGGRISGVQYAVMVYRSSGGLSFDSLTIEGASYAYSIGIGTPANDSNHPADNVTIINPYVEACGQWLHLAPATYNLTMLGGIITSSFGLAPDIPYGKNHTIMIPNILLRLPATTGTAFEIDGVQPEIKFTDKGANADDTNSIKIKNVSVNGTLNGGISFLENTNVNARFGIYGADIGAAYIHVGTSSTPKLLQWDTGAPNGVITGNPGSLYFNTAGGAGQVMWVKESGTGNTGWIAK